MKKYFRREMDRHPEKLVAKAKQCEVFFTTTRPDVMVVVSPTVDPETGERNKYFVRLMTAGTDERHVEMMCSCDFCMKYGNQDRACSHKVAVERKLDRDFGQYASFWADREDAKRQHRIIVELQDLYVTIKNS